MACEMVTCVECCERGVAARGVAALDTAAAASAIEQSTLDDHKLALSSNCTIELIYTTVYYTRDLGPNTVPME